MSKAEETGVLGTQRTEGVGAESSYREVSGQLAQARMQLAMAQRHATKLPLATEDQEKSRKALAEAIALCAVATRSAKANGLYKLLDSGLNPSELRQAVAKGMSPPTDSRGHRSGRGLLAAAPDPRCASLFAQLDACRRMNLEGLRWLAQPRPQPDEQWRGSQLLKIAEQLCVVTALESKLLGMHVIGDSTTDPVAVRRAVAAWAIETTRKEIAAD